MAGFPPGPTLEPSLWPARGCSGTRTWGRAGVTQNLGQSRGHPKRGAEPGSPKTQGPQLFAQGLDCTRDACRRDACSKDAHLRDACSRGAHTRSACTRAWLPEAEPAEVPRQAAWAAAACTSLAAPARPAAGDTAVAAAHASPCPARRFWGPEVPWAQRTTVPSLAVATQGWIWPAAVQAAARPAPTVPPRRGSASAVRGARCGFTALPGTNGFKLP